MNKSLVWYFILLILLCTGFVVGARMMGEQGVYLAGGYMLTPALAALITRLFFYQPRFKDANLCFGKVSDYFKFWVWGLGIMTLAAILYTILGAAHWDFTGQAFLTALEKQFATAGEDMYESLLPGFTPKMMLMLYVIGALTVFNIPGMIMGFGEEFGHRGFMFPLLFKIRPWIGIVIGGLVWYAWHLPLLLVIPQTTHAPLWQTMQAQFITAIGSIFTFTYLAYVYVKSRSVFVTALAHIVMNNMGTAMSYFLIVQNSLLAALGLILAMVAVIALLYLRGELGVFARCFDEEAKDQ